MNSQLYQHHSFIEQSILFPKNQSVIFVMCYSFILTEIHFLESILFHWAIYSHINTILIWLQELHGIFPYQRDIPPASVIKHFLVLFRYLLFHMNYNVIYQWLLPWTSKHNLNPNFNSFLDILAWISNRHLHLNLTAQNQNKTWLCFPKYICLLPF